MMALTANRIFALLLGVWVALGPVMFAVPAAAMSVQTSISDDAGSGGCDACPEGDADRGICVLMCFNATLLATIAEPGNLDVHFDDGHEPGHNPVLLGRLSTPDPTPPKVVSLS